jgi:capsular polysaccharide transport system permease protein
LTPPTANPEASVTDATSTEPAADETEASGPEAPAGGEVTRLNLGLKRRASTLELRVARKRAVNEAEETEIGKIERADGTRTGRTFANTGTRQGPKAAHRAAKAALAEAAEAEQPIDAGIAAADPQSELEAETLDSRPAAPERQVVQAEAATPPAPPAVDEPQLDDDDDDDDRGPGQGGRRRSGGRAEKRNNRGNKSDASNYVVAPTVNPAQMRTRHYGVIAMFLLFVVVPTISYSFYLWTRATDQFESDVGFGSRTEEAPSTFDFLGALGGSTQSGSKDMDILNQFIISQELVAKIDRQLNLEAMFSKPGADPLNAFHPEGTIEDLVKYWQKMVIVNYDNATGLMNLQVFAFDPNDAQKIAQSVLVESTKIINDLSQTAQEDTTRYSKQALGATETKLADARLAVLDYQVRNHIVDPSNAIANQLSVVGTLNQQLAAAQIDLDMLTGTVPATDPRIAQFNRRIDVIRNRIAEEQSKVGAASDSSSPGFAKLMSEFERLRVDQDFAEKAYLSALAAYDQALTDAQHKTRYLATYVAPTLAEASTAPNRPMSAALAALIGFLLWSVVVLVYYALRDRR